MLPKIYSIRASAWSILVLLAILAAGSAVVRATGVIPANVFMYGVQPVSVLAIAGIAYAYARHRRPAARIPSDRTLLVCSVVVVWLVLYFLSGLVLTYVHNSLFTDVKGLAVNLWQFGMVAAAIEYSRYSLMKLVSRRNMLWFGFVLSIVLAVQLMNFGQLQNVHDPAGFIELAISDFLPAIFTSFVLTYLAITSGLATQLIYRLGLVAIAVLSPIIPKYDWYLQGISLILLAVIIYVVVDRQTQADVRHPHRQRNPRRAFDVLWFTGTLVLVGFMTGMFNYRPYAIPTNSMQPTYGGGTMAVVQKISDPMDVKVGDIVQYKTTSVLITHRAIAIEPAADGSGEQVFILQGDNNPTPDKPIKQSQIVGVVRAHVPYLGYPTVWLMELSKGGR